MMGFSRSTGPEASWWKQLPLACALGLGLFALSYAQARPIVGLHQDDGQYVVAAMSLATGQGYRQLHAPDAPYQTKYPSLFPWILSVVWRMSPHFPQNVPLLLGTCSALLAASGALFFVVVRIRYGLPSTLSSAWTLAMFGLPALTGLCAQAMSEAPFVLALTVVFAALATNEPRTRDWWLVGLGVAAAVLSRSLGLGLAGGLLAWCLRRRIAPPGVWLPVIIAPIGWFAWAWSARSGPGGIASYGTSYTTWVSAIPLDAWVTVVRDNLLSVIVHTGHLVAQAGLSLLPAATRPVTALLAGAVVLTAIVIASSVAGGAWAWMLGAYLVMIVVWPWPPSRFILAVLPFAAGFVLGAARRRPDCWPALTIVGALLAAANIAYTVSVARTSKDGLSLAAQPVARWNEYEALFEWIRKGTPPDAVVASVAEPMVYLYTGRRGVFPYEQRTIAINYTTPPSIGGGADLDRLLTETAASYLVRMPAPDWGHTDLLDAAIADLRARQPARLARAYTGEDPRFEVLVVSPPTAASSQPERAGR